MKATKGIQTRKQARLIARNKDGLELRKATRKSQSWDYNSTVALGSCGYWVGDSQSHRQITEEMLEHYGF